MGSHGDSISHWDVIDMELAIRNKLRNTVTQCRKLLEESIAQTLQGHFGIYCGNKEFVYV
jgi:hypothetical protein